MRSAWIGVVVAVPLVSWVRALANGPQDDVACERKWEALTSLVARTLDHEGILPVTPPLTRTDPCVGGRTSFSARRIVGEPTSYTELTFPSGGIEYRLTASAIPDPLLDDADLGVVALGWTSIARYCPPSATFPYERFSLFVAIGVDAPTDVGEADTANPNVDASGPDDHMAIIREDCAFEG